MSLPVLPCPPTLQCQALLQAQSDTAPSLCVTADAGPMISPIVLPAYLQQPALISLSDVSVFLISFHWQRASSRHRHSQPSQVAVPSPCLAMQAQPLFLLQ